MKKFVPIVLGLALFGSAIYPAVMASRNVYHQYLKTQLASKSPRYDYKRVKPFSESRRQYLSNSQADRASDPRNNVAVSIESYRKARNKNYIYPAQGKRDYYSKEREYTLNHKVRPMSESKGVIKRKAENRVRPMITLGEDAVKEYKTISLSNILVQVPAVWKNEGGKYRADRSSFTVELADLNNQACKDVDSFMTCVRALSQTRNTADRSNPLTILSAITRLKQFQSTFEGANLQAQTFTESFIARDFGEEQFITRYYVAGLEGNVYLVETKVNTEEAKNYLGVSKKIFDSFRIKFTAPVQN